MCGIAFINTAEGSALDVRKVTRMLLHELASRGRDAGGVAWKRPDGCTIYRKLQGHPVRTAAYLSQVKGSRSLDESQSVIIHTRFGTIGSPEYPENNHPIIRPGVAMVHNGSIRNAPKLYKRAKADQMAVVDSDSLAALIETAPNHDVLHKRFKIVQGLASLAWLEVTDDPEHTDELHAARLDTRPLVVARTDDGDLIGASTMETLTKVARTCEFGIRVMYDLPEGAVIHAKGGDVITAKNIGTGSGTAESTAEYDRPSKVAAKKAPELEPMW
jgi:glutamine phosphoribosylpyrophosphate amidotransferase